MIPTSMLDFKNLFNHLFSKDPPLLFTEVGDFRYEHVRPKATYAPWLSDIQFQQTLLDVKSHTLIDTYRLWELWWLLEQLKEIPGNILEVGVWRGGSGALLAQRAEQLGLSATTFLCDTFQGVVGASEKDNWYKNGEHADTSPKVVEGLMQELKIRSANILTGRFPEESAHLIPTSEQTFRLCHIDVDVYESARATVDWVLEKLSPGGVIVFDDYGAFKCAGVTQLVNELARNHRVIHNLNGHALLFKK